MSLTKLTESQIEEICNSIPLNPSLPEYIRLSTISRIRTRLYNDLCRVELYPCLFENFKEEILKYYYKTLAASGEAVGVQVAQSIGERQTQNTLNSIDWEDKVLVYDRSNKKVHVEPVGQYIDRILDNENNKKYIDNIPENRTEYLEMTKIGMKDVVMPSVDENGFTKWLRVEAITRHLPVGKLVKVVTQLGREVTATQAKSFLVWDESQQKFIGKNGSDIKVGDYLATSSRNDRVMEETHLALETFFPKSEYLYTTELNKAKHIRENNKNWWTDYQGKKFTLPYSRPDAVFSGRKDNKNMEDGFIYLYRSVKFVSAIPDHIPLDNDFGFLVGIYLAEGCCTKTFTCISNKCPIIRKRITDWCDRYGITYHLTETKAKQATIDPEAVSVDLKLHSVLITRLLTLMCNTGSDKKIVPMCAYTADEKFQRGLIDGYFSGDGTIDKKSGAVIVSSASKELITGISFILSYFGIFGKMSSSQTKKNNIGSQNIKRSYHLSILNGFAQKFARLGLTKPDKNQKLQTITLQKKYRSDKSSTQDSFGINDINVMFDKIVSIEFVDPSKVNVYDFTIAETKIFSLFNALNCYDTFHSSGLSIKTVVVGVPRFSELLNATKSPKMVNCLLYLTESFDGITEVRKRAGNMFTDMTLRRLTQSSELVKDEPLEDWHHLFCELYDIRPSILGWRLRLQIDRSIMYEYQITMKMIANTIMNEYNDAIVLHTPEWMGILDIFIDEASFTKIERDKEKIREKDEEEVEEEVEVEEEELEELEEEEEEEEEENDEDKIEKEKKNREREKEREKERDKEREKDKEKKMMFSRKVKEEKKDVIPEDIDRVIYMEDVVLSALLDIRISGIQGIKDIFFEKRKSEWIITTEGSNLYQLFTNPLIDKTRTMSNDMWEIYNIFGIEAARQFLIEEYMDIVSSDGTFVNSSNVELLVDIMVYTGSIISISRYGQKKVGCGPMAKASFEESLENFLKAGVNGEKESANGVSASIMLGKMPNIGTGVFDLMIDLPKLLELQAQMVKDSKESEESEEDQKIEQKEEKKEKKEKEKKEKTEKKEKENEEYTVFEKF